MKSCKRKFVPTSHPGPFTVVASSQKSQTKVGTLACFDFLYQNELTMKLEDLKVLRRSPDLLNNATIGQGQLQLILEQILFYHIWGLQTFWSSGLNNQ